MKIVIDVDAGGKMQITAPENNLPAAIGFLEIAKAQLIGKATSGRTGSGLYSSARPADIPPLGRGAK